MGQGNGKQEVEIQSGQFIRMPAGLSKLGKVLTNAEIRLYFELRAYSPCHPSLKTLQDNSGLSKGALLRALNGLIDQRLIHRESGRSSRQNNQYFFLPESSWVLRSIKAQEVPPARRFTAGLYETLDAQEAAEKQKKISRTTFHQPARP